VARLISVALWLTSYWLAGPVTAVPRGVAEERRFIDPRVIPALTARQTAHTQVRAQRMSA
jgi:hypothetical protein